MSKRKIIEAPEREFRHTEWSIADSKYLKADESKVSALSRWLHLQYLVRRRFANGKNPRTLPRCFCLFYSTRLYLSKRKIIEAPEREFRHTEGSIADSKYLKADESKVSALSRWLHLQFMGHKSKRRIP